MELWLEKGCNGGGMRGGDRDGMAFRVSKRMMPTNVKASSSRLIMSYGKTTTSDHGRLVVACRGVCVVGEFRFGKIMDDGGDLVEG
ncbi:unnamed protein product [Dovyalis caffra]|uniref:Uncharacterized protein n=1 Tax=Dovyalis caffra TaxID=77055 RepID=A0AAV1RPM9_9ROSI|nr:unnamed protein product [Dovyalis caffra]